MVTSACEIPPAISFGSPAPNNVIDWKVVIIPNTVPNRPANGATTETIFKNINQEVSFGVSFIIASDKRSSIASVSLLGLSLTAFNTRPNGFLALGLCGFLACLLTAADTPNNVMIFKIAIIAASAPTPKMM